MTRVKVFKGKEGLNSLEEIISFSSTPNIIIVNPRKYQLALNKEKRFIRK